ncbi:MAG TPA: hypothetical protein VL769_03800 [Acidimicrobiia bacterium]|nr:hypothetical protein [Acidimicrobiia bacterium]
MKLDGATFLLQWSTGGLAFLWITTRRREVSIGYGWLLRGVYGVMAIAAAALFATQELTAARSLALAASIGVVAFTAVSLTVSVVRRRAGVSGRVELRAERRARVAAMVGRTGDDATTDDPGAEFPPALDLIAPTFGKLGLLAAAVFAGGPYLLAALRLLVGAYFLGAISDAMLLGHWYLVQPGLRRDALKDLVRWTAIVWPFELLVFLWPTGMVQVINATVDDGYHGLLGWIWIACSITTIGLIALTWLALKERYYSAVMAATGLLYLAILTAFGTDLVARAVLRP